MDNHAKIIRGRSRTWKFHPEQAEARELLCRELGISRRLATLLLNRGQATPEQADGFLNPSLHDLPNPFQLSGMKAAVERLIMAFRKKEKIFIFGDYDMDGIAATAILVDFLRRVGFVVDYSIPSRLVDGYGLNHEAIDRAAEKGATLALTVDCGISNREEIEHARSLGLDFIITDHHQVPEQIPAAVAVINPHQKDCDYPFTELAGVGVAFNLMMALRKGLREAGLASDVNLLQYLDLVALGTVADVMPLTGVNRILVAYGLNEINQARRCGLRALLQACRFTRGQQISARDLAFRLAPRVNAVGRIADAGSAVALFLSRDRAQAGQLADFLVECNKNRQEIEKEIFRQAEERLAADEKLAEARVIVLASTDWHPGVVGIVSSRLAESHGKPTLLLALDDENIGRGSGRSIPGLDLVRALELCGARMQRFGGHAQAVGLTIAANDIDELRNRLDSYLAEHEPRPETHPELWLDGILEAGEITTELINDLDRLQPFGYGNPEPAFALTGVKVARATPLHANGRRHFKFSFQLPRRKPLLPGIAFNFSGPAPQSGAHLDLAFTPEENVWRGNPELRLKLIDIRQPEKSSAAVEEGALAAD